MPVELLKLLRAQVQTMADSRTPFEAFDSAHQVLCTLAKLRDTLNAEPPPLENEDGQTSTFSTPSELAIMTFHRKAIELDATPYSERTPN